MNSYDLKNQVIVITGGAGGIGRAVARRAQEDGARVCVWDASMPSVATGDDYLQVDVTDENAVKAAAAKTLEKFGRVDVLVNSAGITGPTLPVADFPLDKWLQVLSINLTGVFLCSRALIPAMQRQAYGRIVNIASIAGKEGNREQSAYSASKAGVIALTKSMGKELCPQDICVNAVAPAMIESELLLQMPEQKRKENLAKIPMGRAGTADEVASLVLWLASKDCSFSTGATFDASGGRATY
ncbi:3-oxoacyl-ACP reductase [Variovorax paradoxus]|uniref:3-oxoacyl-ACP reductase n=1 Tax=Variovorax paradoxus TaxID=34073 RepID=A0AA91DLA0_VARPD|nr:3-oxoacyl-ACP reductase FabG [Variovorax paradoxus]OAK61407.1 3-oxoacyl-ACP reductase [Variovorax paradoxus]